MKVKTIYTEEHGPVVSMDDFDILRRSHDSLFEALQGVIRLAEHGVDICANNSRPEERDGHKDGLLSLIDRAKSAIEKAKHYDPHS